MSAIFPVKANQLSARYVGPLLSSGRGSWPKRFGWMRGSAPSANPLFPECGLRTLRVRWSFSKAKTPVDNQVHWSFGAAKIPVDDERKSGWLKSHKLLAVAIMKRVNLRAMLLPAQSKRRSALGRPAVMCVLRLIPRVALTRFGRSKLCLRLRRIV